MRRSEKLLRRVVGNATAMCTLDQLTSFVLKSAEPAFVLFMRMGVARLPFPQESLEKRGIFPLRHYYYSHLFNGEYLSKPPSDVRALSAIDWRHSEQLEFLYALQKREGLLELRPDKPDFERMAKTCSICRAKCRPSSFQMHVRWS